MGGEDGAYDSLSLSRFKLLPVLQSKPQSPSGAFRPVLS